MGDEMAAEQAGEATQSRRQRTLIAFTYTDLGRGIELSNKIADIGGRSLEITQLAAALDQTATGGTFRGRLGAAKMFGLIDYKGDIATLTSLGEAIIDPIRASNAKVEAFLRVPLYAKLYEQYKGYPLPNAAAIQRQMVLFGVPQKQVERARQAFVQSVQVAGFINPSGRMVKPVVSQRPDLGGEQPPPGYAKIDEPAGDDGDGNGSGGGDGGRGGGGGGGGGKTPTNASEMLLALLDPENMTEAETQAVWTLLLYVKKPKKPAAEQ